MCIRDRVYYLMREIEILKIKRDYQGKVKASIDKNQRDYILREELKVIQEELGEEYTGSDADSFLEQLETVSYTHLHRAVSFPLDAGNRECLRRHLSAYYNTGYGAGPRISFL